MRREIVVFGCSKIGTFLVPQEPEPLAPAAAAATRYITNTAA